MHSIGGPDFLTQPDNPTKSASDPDTIESGTIVRVAVPGIEVTLKAYFSLNHPLLHNPNSYIWHYPSIRPRSFPRASNGTKSMISSLCSGVE